MVVDVTVLVTDVKRTTVMYEVTTLGQTQVFDEVDVFDVVRVVGIEDT